LPSSGKVLVLEKKDTLLQYIDDLQLTGPTQEDCLEGTHILLSLLWKAGYKVSQKKAQICQDVVK
jgi:hypothetical protein